MQHELEIAEDLELLNIIHEWPNDAPFSVIHELSGGSLYVKLLRNYNEYHINIKMTPDQCLQYIFMYFSHASEQGEGFMLQQYVQNLHHEISTERKRQMSENH